MLTPLIDNFCSYIEYQKRYSKHTLIAYKNDLNQFSDYLQQNFEISKIEDITSLFIRSWIVDMLDNNILPRSVNRKISVLKSFFIFLKKENIITTNPMVKVLSPKTSKRLPVFVEVEKMNSLLNEMYFETDFKGTRDKTLIEMFYATGVRLSELINIEVKDVNLVKSQIKVLGKRKKERIIPIIPYFTKTLKEYILEREKVNVHNIEFLFLTEKGKKIYEKLAYRIVNYYLSKVTTIEKKSPHILRHTFATHMLNNGAELNTIKEILGHANLSATQIYTHNTVEKLKKIHQQAHPKA